MPTHIISFKWLCLFHNQRMAEQLNSWTEEEAVSMKETSPWMLEGVLHIFRPEKRPGQLAFSAGIKMTLIVAEEPFILHHARTFCF